MGTAPYRSAQSCVNPHGSKRDGTTSASAPPWLSKYLVETDNDADYFRIRVRQGPKLALEFSFAAAQ
jgi:hypothetical protein